MSYNLTQSDEDYLEAIYSAKNEAGGIRLTDLANEMDVSKASANQAVEKLKNIGLIQHERYGIIYLTKQGQTAAKSIDKRHKAIRIFLSDILKVPYDTAESDACKIEHVISSDTMKRLIDFIENYME